MLGATEPALAGHPIVGGCHAFAIKMGFGENSCTFVALGPILPGMPSTVRCQDFPTTNQECTVRIDNMQSGMTVCQVTGPKPFVAMCPPLTPGKIYTCRVFWNKNLTTIKDAECTG
jgi:hypothetical protein